MISGSYGTSDLVEDYNLTLGREGSLFSTDYKYVCQECCQEVSVIITQSLIDHSPLLFFSYDHQRVKEIGPDRAAAEWIVRCGGSIK